MSVIFGKALYLIPQKISSKRYGRFRGYYAYLWLALCFKNFNVLFTEKCLEQKSVKILAECLFIIYAIIAKKEFE